MKEGDIVETFTDPISCKIPIGLAKLKHLIEDGTNPNHDLEYWWVEFLAEPNKWYKVLIKKTE